MYENSIILFNIELISFINGKVTCIEENVVTCTWILICEKLLHVVVFYCYDMILCALYPNWSLWCNIFMMITGSHS